MIDRGDYVMESKEKADTQDSSIKEFMSQFIPSKKEIPSVDDLIREVAKYYDADRAYIFERDLTEQFCVNTYEWCAQGIMPEIQNLQKVSFEMLEPWWEEFRLKGSFFLSCDDEYAKTEPLIYEVLQPQGISTLMAAPFMSENDMIGFLGVDNPKKNIEHNLFLEVAASKLNQQILTIREKARKKEMDEAFDSIYFSLDAARWEMIFDRNGNMTSCIWSNQFRKMLGYHGIDDFPDELSSWSDLLHPSDKESVLKAYWAAVNDHTGKTKYSVKYRLLMKNGSYRWFAADGSLTRYENGMPKHYYGLFRDINDEVLMKQSLEETKKLAEAANAAKTAFLLRMSHDIRTPINGIMGMLDIADKESDDLKKQADCRRKIRDASRILLDLINEVLDMSKLESGEVQIEHVPFDLITTSREIYYAIGKQAEDRDIEIVQEDCSAEIHRVIGSPLHYKRIVMNIMGNAIKYNKDHGKIYISCRTFGGDGNNVNFEFKCRDTGLGMEPEFLDHIFEPFTQENSNARTKYAGTGLGMSIAKSLVDKMGGTITVESTKGVGTTFDVILPFEIDKSAPKADEAGPDAEPVSIKGTKILLVEDNELNMEIAKFLLADAGAMVVEAWNGKEALDAFMNSSVGDIDVILMDVMMPLMDGYEATRKIRESGKPNAKTIPIIAMTANAFAEDRMAALNAGMNDHVAKPLDVKRLVGTIYRLVKSYREKK